MTSNSISVISFNASGLYNDRLDYVKTLLATRAGDIVMIQESWLLNSDLNILQSLDNDYLGYGKSAIPDKELLQGRPYGGLAFLWHKSLAECVSHVKVQSDRIDAMVLNQKYGQKLLIINV